MKEAEGEEQNTDASQMPSLHLSACALWGGSVLFYTETLMTVHAWGVAFLGNYRR